MIKVENGMVSSEGNMSALMADATVVLLHAWAVACKELGAEIADSLMATAYKNTKNPTIRAIAQSALKEQEEKNDD